MGMFSIGESTSDTRSNVYDSSSTAAGNAVLYTPRRSGNRSGNTTITAGKDATFNITNGVSEEALEGLGASIVGALAPQPANPVQQALEERMRDQIEAGGQTAVEDIRGKLSLGNWILIGVGAFVLISAVWFKKKKK